MQIEAYFESIADCKSNHITYSLSGDTTEIKDFYYSLLSAVKYYTQKNPTTPDITIKKVPEKRKKEDENDSIIFSILPTKELWNILEIVIKQSMTSSVLIGDFISAYEKADAIEKEKIKNLSKKIQTPKNNARICLILCIGENGSMMFNNRRVSRDNIVTGKISDIAKESLYIFPCSSDLFPQANICTEETSFKDGDFLFLENIQPDEYLDQAEHIYLFHWNRAYPADISADMNTLSSLKCIYREEFSGMSHEKITLEVLENGKK